MSTENTTEIFFLKIFKFVILAIMGLALLTTIGALIYAAIEYSQKPKEPVAAKTAPAESVNIDEFLKKIQQVKKVEPTPEEDSPEPTPEQPKQEKPAEKKYLNDARQLLACTKDFEVKAKQNSAVDEEGIRQWLQRNADDRKHERGQPWVTDSVKFNCSVLANQQVIEFIKKNPDIKLLMESTFYHLAKWDEIKNNIAEFNRNEEERIESERREEEARVFAAKSRAFFILAIAGGAFGVFMLLALYLIFSAIESNLRKISDNIEKFKTDSTSETNIQIN